MRERMCRMQDGPPIPWYLAEAVHRLYVECFGHGQSLEEINGRGGFGYDEIKYMVKTRERIEKTRIEGLRQPTQSGTGDI